MEFHEKLQYLRKQKDLTQEQLSSALFVSRTAISKWESGRGYPNIDSLKQIASFFSVTVDELLSGNELLSLADAEQKERDHHFRSLTFAWLDVSLVMLFFLPFFGQKTGDFVQSVSLVMLKDISPYLKTAYFIIITGTVFCGILSLILTYYASHLWRNSHYKVSILLSIVGSLLFIISSQPYAAIFQFVFLMVKLFLFIKKQ